MGRIAVVFSLLVVFFATSLVGRSQQTSQYKSCTLGKGQAKLYNCDSKYDSNGTGSVRITDIDTPSRYVIKLRPNESARAVDEICEQAESYRYRTYSGYCIHKYKTVWIGMLMMINGGNLSHMLTREAGSIDHVEVDGTLRVCSGVVQGNPPNWGIDRIDHLPGQELLNKLYTTNSTGDGVHAYVLDTGIRCSHKEFRYQDGRLNTTTGLPLSRCSSGFDAVKDGLGTNDCNGHGTHCAGIVGGLTTGVAKDVILHPVRVMDCDGLGTYGAVLASLDWISHNLIRPAVLSMSLATQASISIDQAVSNLINTTGIVGVAAAGNFLQATCNYSPARAASVIAVGSSNNVNHMSFFSNYGNCTTLFAPGELIYSTYNLTDSSYAVLSGTSMACPHVAGTAALYLSQNVDARPDDVRQALLNVAEPTGVATTNLKPGTTTKLLNTNIKQPFFRIHPRSFYDASENTTQHAVISLLTKPSMPVTLSPQVDANVGHFSPAQLVFATDANWSTPQTVSLVLLHNPDFLDHSSKISWVFSSLDTQYVSSPEGMVTARDTDVCRTCGETADNPKIIPSLPFYYVDDTSTYLDDINNKSNLNCSGSGPDVVFQYTATTDMVVNVSLCGVNTQFDTILTLYEKMTISNKRCTLRYLECNDDFCDLQSFLMNVALQRGHTYILVIDGYYGASGPVDLYIYPSGAPSTPIKQQLATTIPVINSVITSSSEVKSTICTHWHGETCEASPTSTPIQAGFFWSPVSWGLCNKTCGGGSQQAVMKCFTGNYTEVAVSNCAAFPMPVQTQVCNTEPCHNFSTVEGPWGECNQTCGTGTQKRQVTCMDSLGNTANPSKCGGYGDVQKERPCNTQTCNITYWKAGIWNYCNLPCGKGQRFRSPICFSNGTTVGDNNCKDLAAPLARMDCNTHPCQTFAWLVGRWGDCPSGCNATKNRLVQCVDGLGQNVGDNSCDANKKPSDTIPCQQDGVTCNNCQKNNCSNNGMCKGTECNCFKGWEGKYCEWPTKCSGRPLGYLENGTLSCCPHSKMDIHQRCCGTAMALLDINGVCCDGALDSCGMCNGSHRSIDSQNQCCPTIRDEKGICCASGVLDECYICDGDGTTCASNITITTILDDSVKAAQNSTASWKDFLIQLMAKIATELQVKTEALLLTGVKTTDSEIGSCNAISEITEGCRHSVTTQFLGVFNFTVLPIPMQTLNKMNIELADISMQLAPPDDPTIEFIPGVKMQSAPLAERVGICGNGMCERGERCNQFGRSQTSTGSCCMKDCPFVPKSCPTPQDGPKANRPCSNNGLCLDARGHCQCFQGYRGRSCQHCQNGWTEMKDGTCMKIVDPLRVEANAINFSNINVTMPPGPWNDNITMTKGAAAAGILGTAVTIASLIGIFCCVKHCCCTERKNTVPATSPAAALPRNAETEQQNKQAQEARRKSLTAERKEAVEDRRKSRMYDGGADRKSLLMEPVVVKESPSATLTPAPIQSEPGNVIHKLRKSFLGDTAIVINGKRKSLAGDQEYAKLDPSQLKGVEDRRYQNAPMPSARYEDQQRFQNISLAPQRYEGQQYQNAPQPSPQTGQSYLQRYEGQQYQNTQQLSPNAQAYSPQYDGQRYQNTPSQPGQSAPTYAPRYEGQQYPNVSQPSQSGQPYSSRYEQQQQQYQSPIQPGPYPQTYTPQFDEGQQQQYSSNVTAPRYPAAQPFQNVSTAQQRYERQQQFQNVQPSSQMFQIIPIPTNGLDGGGSSSGQYGNANSVSDGSQPPDAANPSPPGNPNSMGGGGSKPPTANPNSMAGGPKPPAANPFPPTNASSMGGRSTPPVTNTPPNSMGGRSTPPVTDTPPNSMGGRSTPPVTNTPPNSIDVRSTPPVTGTPPTFMGGTSSLTLPPDDSLL
ncbi:unnamed protein product [Calypogeia fissa]